MRRLVTLSLLLPAVALATLALPGAAQEEGEIAEIILVQPRTGHDSQFEEGVQRYFEAVGQQNLPHGWLMWEVMTGKNTGDYYVGTFGHAWSDFDQAPEDPQALQASFEENIAPHVEKAEAAFWRHRTDLSHGDSMEDEEGTPDAYTQLFQYKGKLGRAGDMEDAFRQVAEAAEAAAWVGTWEVFELVNGGEVPLYTVAVGAESFADFAEPEPSMFEMLVGQLGEMAAQELFEGFVDAVEWETSSAIAFREDLSYLPEM